MFGNRKRIQELELQVESLTNELLQERKKYSELQFEMQQHQNSAERDKEGYEELKNIYGRMIQEQEKIRADQTEKLVLEAAESRKALNSELDAARKEKEDQMVHSLKSFSDSYLYYLDQIRILFEMMNAAAVRTVSNIPVSDGKQFKDFYSEEMIKALSEMSGIHIETTGNENPDDNLLEDTDTVNLTE